MIFKCACEWTWVLDFEHDQVIGPFFASYIGTPPEIVLSQPRTMHLSHFATAYSDCLTDLYRKLKS